MIAALLLGTALAQQPPVPRPFPQPGGSQTSRPAAPPPTTPATTAPPVAAPPPAARPGGAPTDAMLGVLVYPGAQYLTSYDAGRGQRIYLYGTTASFPDLVTWYRTVLKQKGELIFEAPATHEFDVGRFRED